MSLRSLGVAEDRQVLKNKCYPAHAYLIICHFFSNIDLMVHQAWSEHGMRGPLTSLQQMLCTYVTNYMLTASLAECS